MRGFGNLKYLGFNNHLLPAVRGKIKYKDGQEGDAHAGDDQVDCVEQGLPPHRDVEGDVQVRLVTARVELDISKIIGGSDHIFCPYSIWTFPS